MDIIAKSLWPKNEGIVVVPQTNMLDYIDGYCGEKKLKFDKENQKFEISNDNELKLLLYGIEQRFYTTPFGQEKIIANSILVM